MDAKPIPCACREVLPDRRAYDLHLEIEYAANRPPAIRDLVLEDEWTIACRRCGRRWRGEHIVGGGIYGDTIWYDD